MVSYTIYCKLNSKPKRIILTGWLGNFSNSKQQNTFHICYIVFSAVFFQLTFFKWLFQLFFLTLDLRTRIHTHTIRPHDTHAHTQTHTRTGDYHLCNLLTHSPNINKNYLPLLNENKLHLAIVN